MRASTMIWPFITFVAIGYFVGSIPTAWLVTRYLAGKPADIRRLGDGNMGATNIGRLFGCRWGVIVGGIDLAKGLIVVGISGTLVALLGPVHQEEGLSVSAIVGGLSVMAGHIWPIWLKFRGGRGAATAVGAVGAIVPVPMLIMAMPTAFILARRRNTSFCFGFIMIWSNVVAKVFFDTSWAVVAFSAALFILVVLTDPRLRFIKKPVAD